MVAQVAADDPDTEPKIPQARMLTCISRPGSQRSHGARPLNISSESEVRNRISPISTKSGSAARFHEAAEFHIEVTRLTSGGLPVKKCSAAHAALPSAIAIHTPPVSRIESSTSSKRPISTELT